MLARRSPPIAAMSWTEDVISPTTLADVADAAATPPMVAAISLAPVAASATDRDISFVVAVCSSTADAIVSW